MKKVCRVCGKVFQARNPIYVTCSPECSRHNTKMKQASYVLSENQKERDRKYQRAYYKKHKKPTDKTCILCGSVLPHGRMMYCLDCLLKDFKYNYSLKARKRLANRGYTTLDAWAEINERGI